MTHQLFLLLLKIPKGVGADYLLQSRGLSASGADDGILHSCCAASVQEAVLDMCRIESMLVCVRLSFLSQALALPLPQLKAFLFNSSERKEPLQDCCVWLARDGTLSSVQAAISSVHNRWKCVVAAASAARAVSHLWRQQWRLLWQRGGMTPQLHGVTGTSSSSVHAEAAQLFEQKFFDWAQSSCKSLWQPAIAYGACLKMVEQSLDSVCCMMHAPLLQKSVYSRIGGERLLEVVSPHRRHLKVLQLWTQVRKRQKKAPPGKSCTEITLHFRRSFLGLRG